VRVELCAGHDLDRGTHQSFASGDELRDIVDDDVLDVGHAIERLGHGSGIYVDLNRRLPPLENIRLELRGNFDDEDKTLRIHRCIDLCRDDLHRRLECRWSGPSAIRRDRSEWSSSTIPTERLVASVEAPVATA